MSSQLDALRRKCLAQLAAGFKLSFVAARYGVTESDLRMWRRNERQLAKPKARKPRKKHPSKSSVAAETKAAKDLLAEGHPMEVVKMNYPRAEI